MVKLKQATLSRSAVLVAWIRRVAIPLLAIMLLVFSYVAPAEAVTPSNGPTSGGTGVTVEGIHFTQIAAGESFTLGLTNTGQVFSWGRNNYGQLGIGSTASSSIPSLVKDSTGNGVLSGIVSISAGSLSAAALTNSGEVYTWGFGGEGLRGDGSSTVQGNLPRKVLAPSGAGFLTNIAQVAIGPMINLMSTHMLAVAHDGSVFAWGINSQGELGVGNTTSSNRPVQVKDPTGAGILSNIVQVAAGANHSLALTSSGNVFAWGSNSNGRLGDGLTTDSRLPVAVKDSSGTSTLSGIANISAGANHSVGLALSGKVYAWGRNFEGQLGNVGQSGVLPGFVQDTSGLRDLSGITGIAAGAYHTLAMNTAGAVVGWGYNPSGQLGNGAPGSSSPIPVNVLDEAGLSALSLVTSITAGAYSSFASDSSGNIFSWGSNGEGELGDGTLVDRSRPVRSVNFQPVTVNFGNVQGTSFSYSGNQLSVLTPAASPGIVSVQGISNFFTGVIPAVPTTVSWDAGTFIYEAPAPNPSSSSTPSTKGHTSSDTLAATGAGAVGVIGLIAFLCVVLGATGISLRNKVRR